MPDLCLENQSTEMRTCPFCPYATCPSSLHCSIELDSQGQGWMDILEGLCMLFSQQIVTSSTPSRMLRQYVRQFRQGLVRKWPLEPGGVWGGQSSSEHLDLVTLGVCRTLGGWRVVLIGVITLLIAGPAFVICFWWSPCVRCCLDSAMRILVLCTAVWFCLSLQYHRHGKTVAFIIGWNILLYLVAGEMMGRGWCGA